MRTLRPFFIFTILYMPTCTLCWVPAQIIMDSGGHVGIELFHCFSWFPGKKTLRKNRSAILRENGISGFSRPAKLDSDQLAKACKQHALTSWSEPFGSMLHVATRRILSRYALVHMLSWGFIVRCMRMLCGPYEWTFELCQSNFLLCFVSIRNPRNQHDKYMCSEYIKELSQWGDSEKYPQDMFWLALCWRGLNFVWFFSYIHTLRCLLMQLSNIFFNGTKVEISICP